MVSIVSERLQETLGYWQDVCWFSEAFIVAETRQRKLLHAPELVAPQLHNWRKFEHVVFDNTVPQLPLSEWSAPLKMLTSFAEFDVMHRFPFEFFEWSRKSRRVFHLPPGLWSTFCDATYPEIRWRDVLFPFDSFIITLDGGLEVILDDEGTSFVYDTILVARTSIASGVSIRLIRAPVAPEDQRRLPEEVKHRFEVLHKRGDQKKTREFLSRKRRKWSENMVQPPAVESVVIRRENVLAESRVSLEPNNLVDTLKSHELARHSNREDAELNFEVLSDAAKIVVGWCLYLRRLTTSDLSWSTTKKRRKPRRGRRGVTGIITEIDHICTVLGEARLDPVAYRTNEPRSQNSGFFKRPHWRSAHDKRPRGSPRNAPKSISIPPLLIRKDLVPFFGIIGGTKTEVLPED